MRRAAAQRGYLLLSVAVMVTLVAAIALLMTRESALETSVAAAELDAQQANYVARAGLNHAAWLAAQQGCGPHTDLTDEPLGGAKYSSKLVTGLAVAGAYTVFADQDTWIDSKFPDSNYGLGSKVFVQFDGVDEGRALLRYDLSAIPPKSGIVAATAWFYITDAYPEGPLDFHRVTADWSETGATWNTLGTALDPVVLASTPEQTAFGFWVPINLTAQVQAWVNGEPNHGIAVRSLVTGVKGKYASRESAEGSYLEIVTGTAPASPATLTARGTLANGVDRKLVREDFRLVQRPGFARLQPDAAAGKDTYLYEWKSTWNYGVSTDIWVDDRWADSTAVGLIRFELGAIPAGARIVGARLELYQSSPSSTGGPIGVYRLDADWDEGTRSGGAGESNWLQRNATFAWANAGGDFDSRRFALESVPAGIGWHSWEIGELVDGWVSGRFPNEGLALYPETSSTASIFASSDATDPTLWPKLSVTYACTCGEVCVAPQGVGNLLLVVADPATPVAADAFKQALFESWGFVVTLIDDGAGQAAYDAAVAANDVVFVSETAVDGTVGTKLAGAPIGVVSQDGDYNQALGFSTSSAWTVGDAIDVISSDHFITRPFVAGPLEIYRDGMEQLTVGGSPSVDLVTLAESAGAASLAVLDEGAALVGGGTAPGRRVMLPLGRETGLNWNYLNNDGLLLVQRALTWGAKLGAVKPNPQLLLVVVDPAALDAREDAERLLIESWGYDVNLIDESAAQVDFDAALAANQVVYVPASIDYNILTGKLDAASIGVVFEEHKLVPDFGLAGSSSTTPNVTEIDIIDNGHYITSPYPLAPLAILSAAQDVPTAESPFAAGLDLLADENNRAVLVALDAGATRLDGNPSPGRRVKLPWGGSGYDPATLTADGETIMRRAIEWAGDPAVPPLPVAHWKLDETGGTTAVDSVGGNDGTLTNGPAWTPGLLDGGLDFDGADDYVAAGSFDVVGSGITMTGWFRADAIPSNDPRIVSKASGTNEADAWWQLSTTDVGVDRFLRMRIKAGGVTTPLADSSVNLTTGQWYFAAATYDGASGEMRLYLDGVGVASGAHAVGGALDADPSVPVALGANGTAERFFDGLLDDVRIYDYALTATEIGDLYDAGVPAGPGYYESDQAWSATADAVWESFDLGTLGVPPGAVAEVAIVNADQGKEHSGGVRATGSTLDRRFSLGEAEGGGVDTVTMHVQVDAAGLIEHYSSKKGALSFVLLGYWVGASYVELFEPFSADASNAWVIEGLANDGVGPDVVTEVAIYNVNPAGENSGGVRQTGSVLERRFDLHEAEGGGRDLVTLMVETDAAANIEVFAQSEFMVFFQVLGYWDTPPGDYVEAGGSPGQATVAAAWEPVDLAGLGAPANTVAAQFALANETANAEKQMGVRADGSSLARLLAIHEAESGGADLASMHVAAGAAARVEWYDEGGPGNRFFHPVGWWVVAP